MSALSTSRIPLTHRALALSTATTVAFAPIVVSHAPPLRIDPLPAHIASVHLTSVVSDADIAALVTEANRVLNQLDTTVQNVAGIPGQTLASALSTASRLTDDFWDSLAAASKTNPLLASMVSALRTVTAGGLSSLSDTVSSAGDTIAVSAGQTASLVTSALSGSAATVLYAAAHVVNNPISLASWAGVVSAPFTIAGGLVSQGATALDSLAVNGITLGQDVITGATQQVTNLLSAASTLFDGVKDATGQQQVNAVLSIVQALVTTPLTAGVTVVDGLTSAVGGTAISAVNGLAEGVRRIDNIWLGNGTSAGAVQHILTGIAENPLSPDSYAGAVGDVLSGVTDTAEQIGNTVVATVVPVPFSVTATLVTTAAKAVNNLADGLATGVVSVLKLAGVNPALANTVYGLVGTVKTAISLAATTTAAALNAVANLAKAALGTPTSPRTAIASSTETKSAVKAASVTVAPKTVKTGGTTGTARGSATSTAKNAHTTVATGTASATSGTTKPVSAVSGTKPGTGKDTASSTPGKTGHSSSVKSQAPKSVKSGDHGKAPSHAKK